jgi:hypothetical protein
MPPNRRVRRHIHQVTRRYRRRIRRLTKRQKAVRIYNRLRQKPYTVRQLGRLERLSVSRVYFYLRYIRRIQKRQGILIQRIGKKLVIRDILYEEQRLLGRQPAPSAGAWELHASVKYKDSPYVQRRIEVDLMILIPSRDDVTIARAIAEIKQLVGDRFGKKLAAMLTFSVVPADARSQRYFRYRHFDEPNYHELW